MGLLAQIFGKPEAPASGNHPQSTGRRIDRVEGARDLWGQDLRGRQWPTET